MLFEDARNSPKISASRASSNSSGASIWKASAPIPSGAARRTRASSRPPCRSHSSTSPRGAALASSEPSPETAT